MSHRSTITRWAGDIAQLDEAALADLYLLPDDHPPWLRVNSVASIDGAAEVGGRSGPLSSPVDQRLMGLLRTQCDALLLGAGTLRIEGYGPLLLDKQQRRWRVARGLPEHPTLVVVSDALALEATHASLADAPTRPVILTRGQAPTPRRTALATVADVITVGDDRVDLAAGLRLLHRRGLRHLLCEGGPQLLGALAATDLIDEVCLTLSPALTGGAASRIVTGPVSPLRQMSLAHAATFDNFLFLRYRRPPTGVRQGGK